MSLERLHSIDRWQIFADNTVDYAFVLLDSDNRVADWNTGAQRLLGYQRDEIVGRPGDVFFTPEDRQAGIPAQELTTALAAGRADDERWHLRKDGTRFRASGVMTALRDESSMVIGFAKVMRDVTAREETREQLEKAVRERNVLLREVHHRVKNNLQMVLSLIRLQADRISDPQSAEAFEETQHRVRTIASVHERLYASADFSTVHASPYLRALVRDVQGAFDQAHRIRVHVDVTDLAVEIGQAVPLALIANELLVNAFKHAFPAGRRGELLLKVTYDTERREAEMLIQDNGNGLPAGVEFETHDSLGFDIARILAGQLHASVQVVSGPSGSQFRFTFAVAA